MRLAPRVSWRVFKNPLSLFIGGVTAVIMELAEPRVRTGIWEHTTFRVDPIRRLRRTGLAAMVTVYGARSTAEPMIARIRPMHEMVAGTTRVVFGGDGRPPGQAGGPSAQQARKLETRALFAGSQGRTVAPAGGTTCAPRSVRLDLSRPRSPRLIRSTPDHLSRRIDWHRFQRDASYHTYRHVRISVITATAAMKANSASVTV
jgi:hypothetical protein